METIKTLNMNELEQINGGIAYCIILGASNCTEAPACWGEGSSLSDKYPSENYGYGVNICDIIGVGFGGNF